MVIQIEENYNFIESSEVDEWDLAPVDVDESVLIRMPNCQPMELNRDKLFKKVKKRQNSWNIVV